MLGCEEFASPKGVADKMSRCKSHIARANGHQVVFHKRSFNVSGISIKFILKWWP